MLHATMVKFPTSSSVGLTLLGKTNYLFVLADVHIKGTDCQISIDFNNFSTVVGLTKNECGK